MSGEGGKVTQEKCGEEPDLDPGMLDSEDSASQHAHGLWEL